MHVQANFFFRSFDKIDLFLMKRFRRRLRQPADTGAMVSVIGYFDYNQMTGFQTIISKREFWLQL